MLETAIILASTYHADQKDKVGEPYILHPLSVMLKMDTDEERVVAVLHDILEDTPVTANMLRDIQIFPISVVDAVIVLTKIDGETNIQYYNRIKQNPLALKVKLADIEHNLDDGRLFLLDEKTRTRLIKKYTKALGILNVGTR